MRYMGIDYGSKRIGVALSDESGVMAFPHSVIANDTQLLATLETLITKERVAEIVIGHSLNYDGQPNKIHAQVEELMTDLTLAVGLPIHLVPELYTTQAAARLQGKHDKIDAAAAALILDTYLLTKSTKR
jgi:putative Holliday junction resolvase